MKTEEIRPYLTEPNLARLTQAERIVIRLHFGLDGEPITLQEIAAYLGISRELVRHIEHDALQKLRVLEIG